MTHLKSSLLWLSLLVKSLEKSNCFIDKYEKEREWHCPEGPKICISIHIWIMPLCKETFPQHNCNHLFTSNTTTCNRCTLDIIYKQRGTTTSIKSGIVKIVSLAQTFPHWNYGVMGRIMVFNSTYKNISVISWRSVSVVVESGVPIENQWHVAGQYTLDKTFLCTALYDYTMLFVLQLT